jgi:hypothetical protein
MQVSTRKIVSIIFLLTLSGIILPSVSSTMTVAQTYPGGYTFYQLTVNSTIPSAGVITPSTGSCYAGQIVNAYEYTNPGYSFDGWYLNGIYEGKLSTIQITMTQDYCLTAAFSRRQVALTINTNPISGGVTTPGIGVYNYSVGDILTIHEYPNTGAGFSGWFLDGVYQGNNNNIVVTMNQDHQINAFFNASTAVQPSPTPTPMPVPPINYSLPIPILHFYTTSSTTSSGFNVKIQGSLECNGLGLAYKGIRLSYSVTGGATWQDLTYVNTGNDGSFTAVWMPSASGNYLIRGIWMGDQYYSCTTDIVNFEVAPDNQNQNTFSVASNSTLSSLTFDSTTSKLSFTVSGPSGTIGYVQACVPKSLLLDPSKLQVTLDGTTDQYTYLSGDNNVWIIIFIYHHSSHTVVMTLDQQAATPTPTPTATPTSTTSTATQTPTVSTSSAATSSVTSPTASPTVPELTIFIILPICLAMIALALVLTIRKRSKAKI